MPQSDLPITLELSLYPLATPGGAELEAPIVEFILDLRAQPGIEIVTNAMSTQLKGPFHAVMAAVTACSERLLDREEPLVLVSKLINRPLAIDETPILG